MSKPVLLQDNFTGIYRDKPRDQLPQGKVWDMRNLFPSDLGASLKRRGPYSYHGPTLNSLDASAAQPARVIVAPFGTTQILAVDGRANPELFDLTNSADRGSIYGASGLVAAPPVFFNNLLIFAGVSARKYDGTTISALGGSPPVVRGFVVYKGRLAGYDSVTPQSKIYFSGAGNPESWDTTNRWLDTSSAVIHLAPMRNSLLVFHQGSVERIRGDIPPGSAAANMTLESLFNDIGLYGPDAMAVTDEFCYWADESGVYRTDGSSFTDLTKQGGISTYWRDKMVAVGTSGHVSLAVWRGYIWISLLGSAGDNIVDWLMYDIDKRAWFLCDNLAAYNFAIQSGTTDELYFANRDTSSKQIGKLSPIFSYSGSNDLDADGTAVECQLETGIYRMDSYGKKRFKNLYLTYQMNDDAAANPTLDVEYVNDDAMSEDTLGTFSETASVRDRRRIPFGKRPNAGFGFTITQSGASAHTRLYALEADVYALEASRR